MSDIYTTERLESEETVIRLLRGLEAPNMLAMACAAFVGPLEIVSQGTGITYLGVRGQTVSGGRVLTEELDAFTLDRYLGDIDKAVSALRTEKTALFGYSHAGYFATAYAAQNPERVSSLVLVEPALFTDEAELRRRAELALSEQGLDSLVAMVDYVSGSLDKQEARRYAEEVREGWQSDRAMAAEWLVRADNPITEKQLSSLGMPVLLIGGTKSKVGFMVERAAPLIPRASVWWVQGADHLSLMSREFALPTAAVIEAFIRQ